MVPNAEKDFGDTVLAENSKGVAELLSSAANPARVKLLTLMLR